MPPRRLSAAREPSPQSPETGCSTREPAGAIDLSTKVTRASCTHARSETKPSGFDLNGNPVRRPVPAIHGRPHIGEQR